MTCSPRPLSGIILILVGGDTEAVIRRSVLLADGYFPGESDSQRLAALLGRIKEACNQAERNSASLEMNAMFGSLAIA